MSKVKKLTSGLNLSNSINKEEGNIHLIALKTSKPAITSISEESRKEMIATSAYYLAKQRGFTPGYEECDRLTAEAEIIAYIK